MNMNKQQNKIYLNNTILFKIKDLNKTSLLYDKYKEEEFKKLIKDNKEDIKQHLNNLHEEIIFNNDLNGLNLYTKKDIRFLKTDINYKVRDLNHKFLKNIYTFNDLGFNKSMLLKFNIKFYLKFYKQINKIMHNHLKSMVLNYYQKNNKREVTT